jgi:tRNA dimethylallyltransferase
MVAVLSGPTASGKSGLALAIARQRPVTIINADASQLYADLRLLTARPSPAEEAQGPHRLFGVLDGDEAASAAHYAALAQTAIAQTLAEGRLPLLVGGTGLYIEVLLHGLAPLPEIDPALRAEVRALPAPHAAAALRREDPAMAAQLRATDTTRLHRALEIIRATGRSLADWQAVRTGGIAASHDVRGFTLLPPRPQLHAAAQLRLDAMLAGGALNEVAALVARRLAPDRPVMKALGVAPLAAHLAGQCSLMQARESTLFATRQYQKRQTTWARGRQGSWPQLEQSDEEVAHRVIAELSKPKMR